MIITRLVLKNWRNFRSADVSLGKRVFLVGPNASGKSNFLDAFRFLRDIARWEGGGLQKAVSDRGGLSKIRCLAARKDPEVLLDVELAQADGHQPRWRYSLGIKQETRGHRQPYLTFETVEKDGRAILRRPDDQDRKDPRRLTQTHLEQISANLEFREIAKFFKSIYYLQVLPQLVRHAESFGLPRDEDDPFGRNFLERIIRTPKKTREARLRRIERALQLTVPQFRELKVKRDEVGTPHLEAVYEHWRQKGARQSEEEFSDGTLRLIALLWSILDGDSTLLIEEPELHLHSAIIRALPSLIARIQSSKKRQILISTHSPDLLWDKGIGGEETLLLIPGKEGTTVQQASKFQVVQELLKSGMSVAEAALPQTAPSRIDQLSIRFSE